MIVVTVIPLTRLAITGIDETGAHVQKVDARFALLDAVTDSPNVFSLRKLALDPDDFGLGVGPAQLVVECLVLVAIAAEDVDADCKLGCDETSEKGLANAVCGTAQDRDSRNRVESNAGVGRLDFGDGDHFREGVRL